ncbi:MAG: class I SAM-dependent methyltransferase [Patescibacteria group bacterium]|nr:class I SAM-dependent methyltransferase [Patescibacteria group bacterium]
MYKITGGGILIDVNHILEKAQIAEGMQVADLGCGTLGHFVFPLAKIVGKHGKVYAVDILRIALDTIDRRIKVEGSKNIETVWSNLEIFKATKIESSSLDAAMLLNTLYLSHKRVEIIRESVRMLKQGGKLMIVEWQNTNIPFGPPMGERVKEDSLIHGAGKFGLKFINEFIAGQYHYGVIFEKI